MTITITITTNNDNDRIMTITMTTIMLLGLSNIIATVITTKTIKTRTIMIS